MNFLKTVIIVVIIAVIIGALIVFTPRFLNQNQSPPEIKTTTQPTQPTPIPTKKPVQINESSNLKEEVKKIEIPDFKEDFDKLKGEIN